MYSDVCDWSHRHLPRILGLHRWAGIIAVIQTAQQAGFTIAEMQMLVNGFAPGTPPAERWQHLARTKLTEIDALIQRAQQMQRILHNALHCGCLELTDCIAAGEIGLCAR